MAEMTGKLVTCDRCGDQVFLRATGEGERDGGFTRWNKFEPFPEGWDHVYVPAPERASRTKCVCVCPRCHTLWEQVLNVHFLAGTGLLKPEA